MPPDTPPLYERPTPRHQTSPSRRAQIQARNRRREHLQRHPAYFDSLDHELADPILYERLVKQYQSAEERAEEGRAKGYGRTLEASLIRGETNLSNLNSSPGLAVASSFAAPLAVTAGASSQNGAVFGTFSEASHDSSSHTTNGISHSEPTPDPPTEPPTSTITIPQALTIDRPWDQPVSDREQGLELWREFLEFRFVHGQDDDFDYTRVDQDQDLDVLEHQDAEDDWYDEEEPSWVDDNGSDTRMNGNDPLRTGETGIQDY